MQLAVVSHLDASENGTSKLMRSSTSARQERKLFEDADKGSFSEAPSILGVQAAAVVVCSRG